MPLPCLCGLVFMRYVRLGPNTRGLLGPPAREPAETKTASKCDETYLNTASLSETAAWAESPGGRSASTTPGEMLGPTSRPYFFRQLAHDNAFDIFIDDHPLVAAKVDR